MSFFQRARSTLLVFLGAFLTLIAVQNVILNFFYVNGAYFLDAGWFAYATWRTDLLLHSPESHPWGSVPYLRQHLALWFVALNGLSFLLPIDHVSFMIVWMGFIYVFGYFVGLSIIRPWARDFTGSNVTVAAVLFALTFAFNGVAVKTLLYPHPEILIPYVIVALMLAVMSGSKAIVALLLVFALSLRTDVGFHVFLFCGCAGLGMLLDMRNGHRMNGEPPKAVFFLGIAAIGFTYSVLAYLLQALMLPGGGQFSSIYLGDPPLSHLTAGLIERRLVEVFFTSRALSLLGFLVCIALGIWFRRWILVFGFFAGLPWLLINLFARSDAAGSFFTYYAFPFVVLLVWPLIFTNPKLGQRRTVLFYVNVALFVSFVDGVSPPGRTLSMMVGPPDASETLRRSELARDLAKRLDDSAYYDAAMISLVGHHLGRGTLFDTKEVPRRTVVYFEPYIQTADISNAAATWGLSISCAELDGPLRLVSSDAGAVKTAQAAGMLCSQQQE